AGARPQGSRGAQGGNPQSRAYEPCRDDRRAHLDLCLRPVDRRPQGGRQRAVPAEQRDRARHAGPGRTRSRDEEGDRVEAVGDEVQGSDRLSAGAAQVTAGVGGWGSGVGVLGLVLSGSVPSGLGPAGTAFAQGRFTNARTETRSGAPGLEPVVRELAGRGGVTWIGYRAPMVAGQRNMCCYDTIADNTVSGGMCRLESGSGVSMSTGDLRDRNGTRIALEPATEFLVLARLHRGSVRRRRTLPPRRDAAAGGAPAVSRTHRRPGARH